MRITKIEVWDFETPFRDGPYNMSHVSQDAIYGQILCLHTEQGISGLGEIVPAPSLAADERLARYADQSTFLRLSLSLSSIFRQKTNHGVGLPLGLRRLTWICLHANIMFHLPICWEAHLTTV